VKFLARIAIGATAALCLSGPALAAGGAAHPHNIDYSFEGPFGKFDQQQLQRGYKVYREVCSACHSLSLVSFRNLGQPGAPFYDPKYPNPNENPYVKQIASEFEVPDIDTETGDTTPRKATSADRFPQPYPNEAAARAGNGGAMPPDLSVITKARHGGAEYVAALLGDGYVDPPPGLNVPAGQYYNKYMAGDLSSYWTGDPKKVPPGGFIAMPPQLTEDRVAFDDGTRSTIEQQAEDVGAFLAWATDPKLEERHKTGFAVLIYLVGFAGLTYASYRRIWRNVAH
jgi:ubiquinol-cytochrome c reductase cytochrome c1 subunit